MGSKRRHDTDTKHAQAATLADLYRTLDARKRPEDVAQMVIEVLGAGLAKRERRVVDVAAKGSLKRTLTGYSSMLDDFARPSGLEPQIRVAQALFASAYSLTAAECADPQTVEAFVRHIGQEIHKSFGASDYMRDRMNRATRRYEGLEISRRRYNKLFRLLARMERKLGKLLRELQKLQFTKIGKSSLAYRISWEDFSADTNTACFIAYYAARCNLRSEFTIKGQKKAFDRVAATLFARCTARSSGRKANYWALAHVYPVREVLDRLTETQQGALLGVWFETLSDIAGLLEETWNASKFQRSTMIVRRGNDSTTWNNTASAWNRARAAWISLLYAMNLDATLDTVCPGKVLRLMAADVAQWHRVAGGGLDPDTYVWNELPLPWQVLSGDILCGRDELKAVCEKHGVDAEKRGWIAPPPKRTPVAFTPTPELVHGISVASPRLAKTLRSAGWFSAKKAIAVATQVAVRTDEHGFITGAYETDPGDKSWKHN